MAKVKAPYDISGSVGDNVFYRNDFGLQMRMKSGPSEWHIQHQPSFKNALRNAEEFKRATAAAQLLRAGIGGMLNGVKNIRLSGRMNKILLQALKADPLHDKGERVVSCGDLSTTAGFEFNHRLSLDDALPLNVENHYTVEGGKVSLQLPAFRIRQKKALPPDATHYRLVSCLVSVDFDKRRHQQEQRVSPLQAMGRKAGEAFCVEHTMAAASPGSFWLVGIQFYAMKENGPKLIKGGALRLMQWIGPVGEKETSVSETNTGAVPDMEAAEERTMNKQIVGMANHAAPLEPAGREKAVVHSLVATAADASPLGTAVSGGRKRRSPCTFYY